MTINVVNTGAPSQALYTAAGILQWTLNHSPTTSNTLIIPYYFESPVDLSVFSPTVTDNQSGNTYQIEVSEANTSGSGGKGSVAAGHITCYNVQSNGGPFIITANFGSGTSRVSLAGNHIEVAGIRSSIDQKGVSTNGSSGSLSSTAAVSAAGANADAVELVVASCCSYIPFGGFTGLSDPPTGGSGTWSSITHVSADSDNQNMSYESGWKLTTGAETSSANWTFTYLGSNSGLAASVITTFRAAAAVGPTLVPFPWVTV